MQNTQKIIDDILESANKTVAAVIGEAREAVDAEEKALEAELAESERRELERIAESAKAVYDGKIKLAELEAGKAVLKAKQECVSAVYDRVRERILSAPDKEYLALLQRLIVSVCEDGDEVVASARDAKRVNADFVKKAGAAAGKKLTLSDTRGDFSGGVILRNARYDRDLTVDEIVNDLKERTVTQTVSRLGL